MLKIATNFNSQRYYAKIVNSVENMKYLNVAEKNDASKTIAGLLSNGAARRREGYSVYNKIYDFDTQVKGKQCKMVMTSVSGHLLQLEFLASYRNWRNVDPQALFEAPIRKACNEDFQGIKRTLEREIKSCGALIIWTDCDREGENIGFEIIDVCRAVKPNIQVYRAIFSEITTASVRRALQNLKEPDKRQSDAVDVRTELDLRTGAAITRFQTMRLQRLFPEKIADKLISYGSCQIPTLGFVAERYKEVEAFVSEPFWKIKVTHTIEDLTVDFNWARNRLFDKDACEDFLMLCLADPQAKVESVTVKPKNKWRPTPLDTVEMEKLGSRKLKLSAKETMTIAEKLYTKGIISYPRTETNMFSKEIDLSSLVSQQTAHSAWGSFAQRVMEWGPNPRNGNKSDQAHPPIHPTKLVTNLDGNEGRVYELICRHFLACVSKDAVGSETVVNIDIAGEKFSANDQVFEPTDISMQEGATTAPPLLTEADLIGLMEKHGIGTDATHAEHINTIKERGYIGVVDNGCLVPGVIGMGLYEGYDAMELVLAKPVLRAQFEADLKKICLGEKDPASVLREQIVQYKEAYRKIMDKISAMDEKVSQRINETPVANANANNAHDNSSENNPNRLQELFECPKCAKAPLALRPKKNQPGFYAGCLNFPDCKNAIWMPEEWKEPSVLEETCPKCGNVAKLLKFKFTTTVYKSMFNAPHGWYKSCLRCDTQLRNAFNINVDSVKRVGGIVGVAPAATNPASVVNRAATATNARSANSVISSGLSTTASRSSNSNSNRAAGSAARSTNSANSAAARTGAPTRGRPKKTKTATNTVETGGNIRNFMTSSTSASCAASSRPATISRPPTAPAPSNNRPIDDFFDSNDGFDELMFAAVDQAVANSTATSSTNNQRTTAQTTTTNRATLASMHRSTVASTSSTSAAPPPPATRNSNLDDNMLPDDLAAAFANCDDADFEDFDWGTTTAAITAATTTRNDDINWGTGTTVSGSNNADESFGTFFRNDNELDNYEWGSAARNSQTANTSTTFRASPAAASNFVTSPAAKRTRVDADFSAQAAPTGEIPKCTGCHQLGKQLSVKKEGPNKGRLFYVCPKPNACKFFQWADELSETSAQTSQTHAAPRATASQTHNTQSLQTTANEDAVKCGCGNIANSLTVRKEGPNVGRPFYACSNRDKSCGFFQWADEEQQASTSTGARQNNQSWGSNARYGSGASSSNFTSLNNKRTNDSTETKKRKCGLCRQEGHTKSKCPRKAEFEF